MTLRPGTTFAQRRADERRRVMLARIDEATNRIAELFELRGINASEIDRTVLRADAAYVLGLEGDDE